MDWRRAAEARAKLSIRSLSEKKRQLSRILTFLESHLVTRDNWTEEEFRKLLDQIDEGEAKHTGLQVSYSAFHVLIYFVERFSSTAYPHKSPSKTTADRDV
jgi:hypothetical protein